tara:strand:- start:545 stop:1060 length:516 start_codon:yes stop_codon:yes gene_type:complete
MAKSDSFFIRATLEVDDSSTFQQTEIDLGAYVDALGKSVLRIHNLQYEVTDDAGLAPNMDGNAAGSCTFQVTTQSQSAIQKLSNKSIVTKGVIWARNPDGTSNPPAQSFSEDVTPQIFTNGYLIATESIYLGASADAAWAATANLTVSIMMECTVETMSQAAAMALALSQQ